MIASSKKRLGSLSPKRISFLRQTVVFCIIITKLEKNKQAYLQQAWFKKKVQRSN
jgi:hypothetical protein